MKLEHALQELYEQTDPEELTRSLNGGDTIEAVNLFRRLTGLCRGGEQVAVDHMLPYMPAPAIYICPEDGSMYLGVAVVDISSNDAVTGKSILTPKGGIALSGKGEITHGSWEAANYYHNHLQNHQMWIAAFYPQDTKAHFAQSPDALRRFLYEADPQEYRELAQGTENSGKNLSGSGRPFQALLMERLAECYRELENRAVAYSAEQAFRLAEQTGALKQAYAAAQGCRFEDRLLPLLAFRNPLEVLAFEYLETDELGDAAFRFDDMDEGTLEESLLDCMERYPILSEFETPEEGEEKAFMRRLEEEFRAYQLKAERAEQEAPDEWRRLIRELNRRTDVYQRLSEGYLGDIPLRLLARDFTPLENVCEAMELASLTPRDDIEDIQNAYLKTWFGVSPSNPEQTVCAGMNMEL